MSADNQVPKRLSLLPIEFVSFDAPSETTIDQVVFICDVQMRLHGRDLSAQYRFDLADGCFIISTLGQAIRVPSPEILNALLHRISETKPEVLHAQTH